MMKTADKETKNADKKKNQEKLALANQKRDNGRRQRNQAICF